MNERSEKIQQLVEIRKAVYNVVDKVFEEILSDLEDFTFEKESVKLIRASRAKLAIRSLRKTTLERLANLGEKYE